MKKQHIVFAFAFLAVFLIGTFFGSETLGKKTTTNNVINQSNQVRLGGYK